jgi:hypothetical protein
MGFNFGEAAMGSLSERGKETARNERVIGRCETVRALRWR